MTQEGLVSFHWKEGPEPHAVRRSSLLKSHPEISSLTGHEWRSKWICLLLCFAQVWVATQVAPSLPVLPFFLLSYLVGATLTQSLFLAVHELSHNLFFRSPVHNRLFSILVANAPIPIPFASSFRLYHTDHHKQQGVDGVDTDIPSEWEAKVVRRDSPFSKWVWLSLQIVAYSVRPLLTKTKPLSREMVWNAVYQICVVDTFLLIRFGVTPLLYLLLSVLLAGGMHPCAGHFLSEHYVFPGRKGERMDSPSETYSYYGPLNWLTWNVGYHNEHHDFPNVPWSRLPSLRRVGSEVYDSLPRCESWPKLQWEYLFDSRVGPYSRVKRRGSSSRRD